MKAPMLRLVCLHEASWKRDCWLIILSRSVANEQGSYTTPSFVSFTEKERLIGEAAKNQAAMNPKNTIFDIKCVTAWASNSLYLVLTYFRRLIGRRYDDPIVKKDVESWPFKVVDQGGSPAVEVEYLGETKTFTPQEISSMVLMKVIRPINSIARLHNWWYITDERGRGDQAR